MKLPKDFTGDLSIRVLPSKWNADGRANINAVLLKPCESINGKTVTFRVLIQLLIVLVNLLLIHWLTRSLICT